MKKIVVIDIGTNSIKYLKAEISNNKVKIRKDINIITGMGEGLSKTNKISDKAINRNFRVLKELLNKSIEFEPDEMIATGTMWLRQAINSEELLKKARKVLGLDIQLLNGKEEARYSYLGATSNICLETEKVMVFDIGGGSTEIIKGKGKEISEDYSLNFGAVTMTEEYFKSNPVKSLEVKELEENIINLIRKNVPKYEADICIGMGGTVTTMAAIKHKMGEYDPEIIQNSILEKSFIKQQIELFKKKTIKQRKEIIGLHPQRAEVILAGAVIVKNIVNYFNFDCIKISNRGLRHGILYEKLQL